MPPGADADTDMVRQVVLSETDYDLIALQRGWIVLQDLLRRVHKRPGMPNAAMIAIARRLYRRHSYVRSMFSRVFGFAVLGKQMFRVHRFDRTAAMHANDVDVRWLVSLQSSSLHVLPRALPSEHSNVESPPKKAPSIVPVPSTHIIRFLVQCAVKLPRLCTHVYSNTACH